MSFATAMEAKEFLVSRIGEEASRQQVGLSDLERKMLYFSERYATLPDMMEVAEKFEAEYDDEKYEKKIEKLSRKAFERDQEESPENVQLWREAIEVLKKEDHYILVMLDVPRSTAELAKLILAVLVMAAMVIGAIAALDWASQNIRFRIPDYVELLALILFFPLAYYFAYSDKGKKLGDCLGKLAGRVARWF